MNTLVPQFCCVHFSRFRLQVFAQVHPEWADQPYALVLPGTDPGNPIDSLSLAARRMRIPLQARIVDVQKHWPQVPLFAPALDSEILLQQQLLACADAQTPVYSWERDCLHLDLSGTERIHGSDWHSWANRFLAMLRERTGLAQMHCALASTPEAANLLARAARQSTPICCAPGQERATLSRVPLRLLDQLSLRTNTRFRLHRLHTLGDLQRLDRKTLSSQFGAEGEHLYAIAQGYSLKQSIPATTNAMVQFDLFG